MAYLWYSTAVNLSIEQQKVSWSPCASILEFESMLWVNCIKCNCIICNHFWLWNFQIGYYYYFFTFMVAIPWYFPRCCVLCPWGVSIKEYNDLSIPISFYPFLPPCLPSFHASFFSFFPPPFLLFFSFQYKKNKIKNGEKSATLNAYIKVSYEIWQSDRKKVEKHKTWQTNLGTIKHSCLKSYYVAKCMHISLTDRESTVKTICFTKRWNLSGKSQYLTNLFTRLNSFSYKYS